jgi:hypothetical protein
MDALIISNVRPIANLIERVAVPLEYYIYYEPNYYSFWIHDIDIWQPNSEIVDSSSTLKLWLYSN